MLALASRGLRPCRTRYTIRPCPSGPQQRQCTRQLSHSKSRHSAHPDTGGVFTSKSPTSNGRASRRSCLITGGTSGIGFQVAKQLLLEGASAIQIVSRDHDRGANTVERLLHETGINDAKLRVVTHDFTATNCSKIPFFDEDARSPHPRVDTVIHCAGVAQSKLLLSQRDEEIAEILKLNLESGILLSRAFLSSYLSIGRKWQKQRQQATETIETGALQPRSFSLVTISSLLAVKGGLGASTYAASKAGVQAFTRALVLEASQVSRKFGAKFPKFRANCVVPGYVTTPMTQSIEPAAKEQLSRQIPLDRFGTVEEVADAVLFLIANEYANNTVLNLDGGLSAT